MSAQRLHDGQHFDFASHPLFSSTSTNASGFDAIPVAPVATVAPTTAVARVAKIKSKAPVSGDFFFQKARHVESDRLDAQPGYLRLVPGRAVTLKAAQPGVLRIAQGRVWVTFCDAARDSQVRAGDYFVDRSQGLPLLPGQSVVIEAFSAGNECTAFFSWDPVAPQRTVQAAAPARWALT